MSDPTLLLLLDEVRSKTLRRLEGVTAEESHYAPAGTQNTILWHAGHAFVVVEWLSSQGLEREPNWPEGWRALFGKDSQPAETPRDAWPALDVVITRLNDQRDRLNLAIQSLNDFELERRIDPDNPLRTTRYMILHGLHDEACHSGEIWLLRKLWKAENAAPARSL